MERTINTMMGVARYIQDLARTHDAADVHITRAADRGLNIWITGCFLSDAEWLQRRANAVAGEHIQIYASRDDGGLLLELERV